MDPDGDHGAAAATDPQQTTLDSEPVASAHRTSSHRTSAHRMSAHRTSAHRPLDLARDGRAGERATPGRGA